MEPTIHQIAQSSPIAKEVFKVLERRQRFRKRSDISRIYREVKSHNINTDPKEVLSVFKELQTAGVGSIVLGRKNNPNRFVWKYNLKHVAKAAKKEDSSVKALSTFGQESEDTKQVKAKPNVEVQRVTRSSTVSANKPFIQITLRLPADINMEDLKAYLDLAKSFQK